MSKKYTFTMVVVKPTGKGGKPLKPKEIKPKKKMGGGMMRKYSTGAMAEDRAMEGKKAAYKKMGFEDMMKSGEIKFPGSKKKRTRENPMKEERFQRTRQSAIAKVVGKENVSDPRKVERKMGGGMMKKYNKGGQMLKGGQKKLDKNKDGKISGEDFKLIRREKPEMKPMKKSMGGEMKKGYGAARQSGMGLQDENLVPGKSMDYYKDLM